MPVKIILPGSFVSQGRRMAWAIGGIGKGPEGPLLGILLVVVAVVALACTALR